MESTRIWHPATFALLAALTLLPRPAAAQKTASPDGFTGFVSEALQQQSSLDVLFARLLEAARLPDALKQLPSHERLIVIDAQQRVMRVIDGASFLVELDWELEIQMHRRGADLVLVHNHPTSTGLSRADLEQLTKPGVAAVIAIGHDGSMYAAGARPEPKDSSMRLRLVTAASNEIARQLRTARPAGRADGKGLDLHMSHLVSLALESVGIIEYYFALAPSRQQSYDRLQSFYMGITQASAAAVRSSLDVILKLP